MLDRLIKSGIKYLFVSNSDNLGATLDLDLLAYFATSKKAFVMEVGRALTTQPLMREQPGRCRHAAFLVA